MSFLTADSTSQLAQPDPAVEFLLVNNDTVNPIYVSQLRPCNTQSNKIPPQGQVTLTGWWYVSTLNTSITVECYVFPGGTSWNNPVGVQIALSALGLAKDTSVNNPSYGPSTLARQITGETNIPANMKNAAQGVTTEIAALIATGAAGGSPGGVPLLGFKRVLGSNTAGLAIGANTTVTPLNLVAISQVGYEMAFSIATAAGTATPLLITVSWNDSATGILTDAQDWTVFSGTNAAPHVVRITGPSNGDQITVNINNGGNAITVKYVIMQVSRVYTRHFGHTNSVAAPAPVFPGFTFASGDASSDILAAESQVVNAASNLLRLLPLYSGTARFWGRASLGTGTDSEWRIEYPAAILALNDTIPYQVEGNQGFSPAGQGSMEIDNVALTRWQMTMRLVNHNASTANTMEAHLIAREIAA